MTPRQAYAARAETARYLRVVRQLTIRDIAAIFKTTPEPARKLVARGERLHREQIRTLFNGLRPLVGDAQFGSSIAPRPSPIAHSR